MNNCGQSLSSWNTTTRFGQRKPKKDSFIDRQMISLRNEKAKTKATEKCLFELRKKNIMNRPATLYEILLVKSSASKDQIEKHYHKMSLLMHTDAGGAEEFKTINREYQILIINAAREACNIWT